MIKVKRKSDGKIFTNDMSSDEGIIEMHFCTSYTQVIIQEKTEEGNFQSSNIICEPENSTANPIDLIAVYEDESGSFIQ